MAYASDTLPRREQLERPGRAEDPVAAARVQRARHTAMLEEIAEMAMDLARSAYRRAKAEEAARVALAERAARAERAEAAGSAGAWDEAGWADDGPAGDALNRGASAGGGVSPEARSDAPMEARIDALKGELAGAGFGGPGRDDAAGGLPVRGDPSLVFARLSRVVFRALALAGRVSDTGVAAAEAHDPVHDPVMTPERKAKIMARWELLLARKNLVVEIVEDAIRTQRPEATPEISGRALNDRLLEFERFEVLNDTIRATSTRWCEKLGLKLDWSRWADKPWAIKEQDGYAEWVEYRGGGLPP